MAFAQIFQSGPRLIDGLELNEALAYPRLAYAPAPGTPNITARAAGTVANSPLVTETITQIDTVASAADGVALPAAVAGAVFILINNGANAMQVFARGGSTINGTAGAAGVSQAAGRVAIYVAAKNGAWFRHLSA